MMEILKMCFTGNLIRINEQSPPSDLKIKFHEYTGGGTHMMPEQLGRFLVEFQGEGSHVSVVAEKIMEQVLQRRHHRVRFTRHIFFTLDDFFHYLFSPDLNPPIADEVHQDMTAPLSNYFIYTGHNSYLTGNQLSSASSHVPIINALNRGVRAVELDLWPNSTKDDVHVLHGWTLTSPVELIKCLKAIKEHAFSASPYPVILTLEDHLNSELQAKVAQMIIQTFGDMVFYPESESLKEFPSPEDLKYKIIISTKLPKQYRKPRTSGKNRKIVSQNQDDFGEHVPAKGPSNDEENGEDDNDILRYKYLIAVPASNAKTGLKKALKLQSDQVRRLSLREQMFKKAIALYGTQILKFTQKNLLRIYPKGTRINSSNYNPIIGWKHGAQMVAFNMQGYGRSLWLMHGMFRANGGCGYVKKPDLLMKMGLDPIVKLPVKKTLKIKVYMGYGWHLNFKRTHFDLCSTPDFYSRVGIAGVAGDKKMKKTKTKENSWTPVWNEEFTFPLTVPELALLRLEVHDYNMSERDDFAGQTCLPVSELKPGIRAIPLFDRKGDEFGSVRLLVRFEFVLGR